MVYVNTKPRYTLNQEDSCHFDRAEKSFILRLPWTVTRKTHYWHLEGVTPPEVVDSAPGWWLWDVRMCKGFQSQYDKYDTEIVFDIHYWNIDIIYIYIY